LTEALVLTSGGMDSAVCLYIALAEHGPDGVEALFFDWGQRAVAEELGAARNQCREAGLAEPVSIRLDFPYGGPLTDDSASLPTGRTPSEIGSAGVARTFFPGRNIVMLAYAYGLAAARGHQVIYFGPNADDAAGYPDCRADFVKSLEVACRQGTDSGISLAVPLIEMSKADIVREGNRLRVPWDLTFSCYSPVDGRHCGRCDSCVLRSLALSEEG